MAIKNNEDLNLYKLNVISKLKEIISKLNTLDSNKIKDFSKFKLELLVLNKDIISRIEDKNSVFLKLDIICKNLDLILRPNELSSSLIFVLNQMLVEIKK